MFWCVLWCFGVVLGCFLWCFGWFREFRGLRGWIKPVQDESVRGFETSLGGLGFRGWMKPILDECVVGRNRFWMKAVIG